MATSKLTTQEMRLLGQKLAELRPILAGATVGDFSKDLDIPNQEDEFTELFVGVQMMVEVIREQLSELKELNLSLEAKAAERSIALEEAQALTHLGSWQWDVATNEVSWSDELYRIYGMKPQEREIAYEDFLGLIHPEDVKRISDAITHAFKTAQPFEFEHRIILPNKNVRIVNGKGKVITNASGQPMRMVGTAQDITERKKAELALERSNERFNAVAKATNDAVYDLDLQSKTLWWNDAFYSVYGYSKDKTITTLDWWMAHIHPDDSKHIQNELKKLVNSRSNTWVGEYRFRKHDGKYIAIRDRAFVLRDNTGKPIRMIGSMLDITKQKELERAKDEFMSLASHQLRTPLTSIRLFTEMLAAEQVGKLNAAQHDYVEKVELSTKRMIALVNDILSVSRTDLGRLTIDPNPTDITRLIQSIVDEVQPLATQKNTRITFESKKGLPSIPVDQSLLCQVVQNLLTNAIRYVDKIGGSIKVSLKKEKSDYLLTVSDDGIGIPKADQPYIFNRFFRASNAVNATGDGTGLGLYLVRMIMESAGGKVWFESKVGKGTTFYVQIPLGGMRAKES